VAEGLELEEDAGLRTLFRRAPDTPATPPGLPGRYACGELGAEWIVGADHGVTVRGPHANAGPWRLEAIAPGLLRLHAPGVLFDGWYDIGLRPDGALEANGARARGLVFERIA
jgi:hypothetical protein